MTAVHTVLLPVGTDVYAVRIDWVREVLAAPAVTHLATAPSVVLGLINLRGEIVVLLDTAALLGVGTVDAIAFAVVVNTAHGPAALAVTGFPERAELTDSTGPSELPGTAGTFQVGRRVAVLLELSELLAPEHLGAHDFLAAPATFGSP